MGFTSSTPRGDNLDPHTAAPSASSDPNALTLLTPAESHLESRLASLTGGTVEEHSLAWSLFISRSAYSPLRLARELSWEPVPRDGSSHGGDGTGWTAAFEDLLLASSGLPMRDLGPTSSSSFRFGSRFREMLELEWFGRMTRRGLPEVYFPYSEPADSFGQKGYTSPRTMEEWVARRRAEQPHRDARASEWPFGEHAQGRWRRWDEREGQGEQEKRERGSRHEGGLFGEIEATVKALEQAFSTGFGERGTRSEGKNNGHDGEDEGRGRDASVESELYSLVRSAFESSGRSLSTLFKTISSGGWDDTRFFEDSNVPEDAKDVRTSTNETVENGLTKTVTTKEYVDRWGANKAVTETTWKDQEGRTVMKSSSWTTQKEAKASFQIGGDATRGGTKQLEKGPDAEVTEGGQEDEEKKKKSWLWK